MAIRDLIPWSKPQQLAPARDSFDPFLTLHREMNRLFDDVFRGFGSPGLSPSMEGRFAWPKVELSETDKALTVSAELPGMTEKDVQVEIANGVLTIRGEKKAEHNGEGPILQRTLLRRLRASDSGRRRAGGQGRGIVQERHPDRLIAEIGTTRVKESNASRSTRSN